MRYTIQDFNKEFPDNDSCLQYLFNQRFSNAVSPKYLQTYVDEFAYRYNQRKSESPLFLGLVEKLF